MATGFCSGFSGDNGECARSSTVGDMRPLECGMPELGTLEPLVDPLLFRVMMDGRQRDKKEYSIERNFVRLVDKTVRAYVAAKAGLTTQVERWRRLQEAASKVPTEEFKLEQYSEPAMAFTDHFEDCITTTNRLLKLLRGINASKTPIVSREARRSIEASAKAIDGIRNMIEHISEAIANEEFSEGQMIMVGATVDGSAAILGPNRIAFADICIVIRRLHEIAKAMMSIPMEFANASAVPANKP